jgi:hypothetical protein
MKCGRKAAADEVEKTPAVAKVYAAIDCHKIDLTHVQHAQYLVAASGALPHP